MIDTLVRFFSGKTTAQRYLAVGLASFALKYVLDVLVSWYVFGVVWLPTRYFDSSRFYSIWNVPPEQYAHYMTLLLMSLPFIVIGVGFTVRRLRDADLPVWLAALFFVPLINLLFFLALLPVKSRGPAVSDPEQVELPDEDVELQVASAVGGRRIFARHLLVVLFTATLGLLMVVLGVLVFQSYGWGIFVGIPFIMGMMARAMSPNLSSSLKNGVMALLLTGIALIAIRVEGFICLLMAFPIALLVFLIGAVVTEACCKLAPGSMCLAVMAAMGIEGQVSDAPVREVQSSVTIAAPPEKVWPAVVAFKPLPPPTQLLFRAGIAYPTHAEINGSGVGAIRR